MQHDTICATTLTALSEPARKAAAPAGRRLGRLWHRSMGWIARYRARHEPLALDEHMLRDVGLTRAGAPRWVESRNSARMCAGAWGWDIGTAIRAGVRDAYPCRAPSTGRRENQRSALPIIAKSFEWMSH
jgi:uncharacterized protein YjiS (DUF1127 family)